MSEAENLLRKEIFLKLNPYYEKAQKLKIDHIGYREFHRDGTSAAFCSHSGWYEVQLDEEAMHDMSLHYAQELMIANRDKFGLFIRNTMNVNNRFLQELMMKDMCNSLIVYRKSRDVIRLFAFIANSSNHAALNYFVNKTASFEGLVTSYQHEFINIFQKPEYLELRKPLFSKKVVEQIFTNHAKTNVLSEELTEREVECLELLLLQASDKEIAQKLNICPKTVGYHIANIKRKTKTKSRFDICNKVKEQLIFKETI